MKRVTFFILFVFSSVIFFFSCQKEAPKGTNRMLRVNFIHEPATLDPRKGTDIRTSTLHFMLYEGLTRMKPESTHEPGLAYKIDISKDRCTYTFHLRESNWSNGDPVTAHDFEYAWKSMIDPDFPCPNANLLYPIKNAEKIKRGLISSSEFGARALNDLTFEVTLERPCPYFLDLTSFCIFFPVPHKIAKEYPKWGDELGPEIVTNGPFRLIEWKRNNQLTLEKNPLFWEKGLPKLDGVLITLVPDEVSVFKMYENEELDLMGHAFTFIPSECIPKLAQEGLLHSQPLGATTFCTFNLNTPLFQNKNIRKAFAYAIDRKALIENITQFDEIPATGCLPPVLKHNILTHFFVDANNKEAEKFLQHGLKELNLAKKDLPEITFIYHPRDPFKKIAQALQQQWKTALGIDVKLEENDFKVHLDKLRRKNYEIAITSWATQYNDPIAILDLFKFKQNPNNCSGWEDPEYIRLLDQSAVAETDKQRFALIELAEKKIVDEMPFTNLYHWNCVFLQNDRVKNFYLSPIGSVPLNETYID